MTAPFQDDLRKRTSLRPSLWKRVEGKKKFSLLFSLSKRFSVKHHPCQQALLFFPTIFWEFFHGQIYFCFHILILIISIYFNYNSKLGRFNSTRKQRDEETPQLEIFVCGFMYVDWVLQIFCGLYFYTIFAIWLIHKHV